MSANALVLIPLALAINCGANPLADQRPTDTGVVEKAWGSQTWTAVQAGRPLNLARYILDWHDEFDTCDIINDNNTTGGVHNWYAAPSGVLGRARMVGVDKSPRTIDCADGELNLTLRQAGEGAWNGALIRGLNSRQEGHSLLFGYWEARIRLPKPPAGLAPWPSFWFESRIPQTPPNRPYVEIDLFEGGLAAAGDLVEQATTLHEWPAKPARDHEVSEHLFHQYRSRYALFDDQWHTYGLELTPSWIIYYRDRLEVARHANVQNIAAAPIYPELDVSLYYPATTSATNVTYTMSVDYVRTYRCAGNTPACQ